MEKIKLHELVAKLLEDLRLKYGIRIKLVDYYISWTNGMLVTVDELGFKHYWNHKKWLKNWGLELDETF